MARWPNEDFSTGVWLSQWSADWPWTWDENRNSSLEYKKIYIIKRFTNRECSRACFHAASFCPSGGQSAKPPSQCITSNLNCSICPFFSFSCLFFIATHCLLLIMAEDVPEDQSRVFSQHLLQPSFYPCTCICLLWLTVSFLSVWFPTSLFLTSNFSLYFFAFLLYLIFSFCPTLNL